MKNVPLAVAIVIAAIILGISMLGREGLDRLFYTPEAKDPIPVVTERPPVGGQPFEFKEDTSGKYIECITLAALVQQDPEQCEVYQ